MYYCHGIYDLLAMQIATCSGRAIQWRPSDSHRCNKKSATPRWELRSNV